MKERNSIMQNNDTTTCNCPDCEKPFNVETYVTWKGETRVTLTCRTPDCLLNSVTLTAEEWQTKDLEQYRQMNAAKAGQS
jgi:hypothetical protein